MGIPRVKVAPSCSSLEQGYEHPRNARPMLPAASSYRSERGEFTHDEFTLHALRARTPYMLHPTPYTRNFIIRLQERSYWRLPIPQKNPSSTTSSRFMWL
jgi:hypothetical protein